MIRAILFFIFWCFIMVFAFMQAQHNSEEFKRWTQKISVPSSIGKKMSKIKRIARATFQPRKTRKKIAKDKAVTLHLKNGSMISGELFYEDEEQVRIRWQGGEVGFKMDEIDRIERGEARVEKKGLLFPEEMEELWPYQNDVVIHLKDGRVLDEPINKIRAKRIVLRREFEEGGAIEQEILRDEIEFLSFKPIKNARSEKINEALMTQFPKMKRVREGSFVLMTDSYTTWVNAYKKGIQQLRTDFYLEFFPILKDRSPNIAHYVVIFDERNDFIDHGVADGVPSWGLAGYFSPDREILYLFNVLGDTISTAIEEAIVGQTSRMMDGLVDAVKGQVDRRYHVFIEGQATEFKKKFSGAHSYIRGLLRDQTMATLRHEMTHELFHNWGLQTIVISKAEQDLKEEAEKKKRYLQEEDVEKRRELLFDLAQLRKDESKIEITASNSWFVEGLAAYMEEVPVGAPSKRWLYLYQDARRKEILFPIEYLTVYKMGSFPGVASEAQLYAYAESWAFVHFLMQVHRDGFMEYLGRVSQETPQENEDILWLLKAVGKELRPLEGEFIAYMDQFEELDDPMFEQMDTFRSIFQSF